MRRFLRRNTSEFIWMLSIVVAIVIISVLGYDIITCIFETTCQYTIKKATYWIYGIIIVVLLLYVAWVLFFKKNHTLKEIWKKSFWKELFKWNNFKNTIIPILLLVVILVVLVILLYYKEPISKHIFINPGGLFGIVMGFATVIGTYLAIKSIVEMKHTITSYPQLYESLINLINDPESKEIRIVSYFILPGYWQVQSEQKKKNLKAALSKAKNKIKIACIKPEEHLSILIDVAQKGTKTYSSEEAQANIIEFQKECEDILSKFMYHPNRLNWKELPYYYFFVTEKRAIIVTPVGLPILNEKIDKGKVAKIIQKIQSNENNNVIMAEINSLLQTFSTNTDNQPLTVIKVDTLGFETTDQHIIDELQRLFDVYYDKISETPDSNTTPSTNNSPIYSDPNPAPNANENVNVAINKTTNTTDVLVEVSNKITVKVNIQD